MLVIRFLIPKKPHLVASKALKEQLLIQDLILEQTNELLINSTKI